MALLQIRNRISGIMGSKRRNIRLLDVKKRIGYYIDRSVYMLTQEMQPMKSNVKQKIIETASELFQIKGIGATGLSEILQRSGAPKGSLYYYFPGGKEALVEAAAENAARIICEKIQEGMADEKDPVHAVQHVIEGMEKALSREGRLHNLSISLIALETYLSDDRLRGVCHKAFLAMERLYAERMKLGGIPSPEAEELGCVIQSLIEGALILSVTGRDNRPLRAAGMQVAWLIRRHQQG